MNTFKIVLVVGLPCSAIASLMAYVTTLEEYAHHFVDKSKARRSAFEVALSTFLFFGVLTVILGLLLSHFI